MKGDPSAAEAACLTDAAARLKAVPLQNRLIGMILKPDSRDWLTFGSLRFFLPSVVRMTGWI